MQIPFLPPGSLWLLPAVVSLLSNGDRSSPWYFAALTLAALDGAINAGRIIPGPGTPGLRRLTGLVLALGAAHLLAEGPGGSCCATGRR